MPHAFNPEHLALTRRQFLNRCGMGLGAIGLGALMQDSLGPSAFGALAGSADTNPLDPKQPHFPANAKHIIHIFPNGAPSPVDTFDPKPALEKYVGKPLP